MSLGGQFYREKFKPPTIQYIEEHFAEFRNFMENMSPEFVEYVKNITENYVTYVTSVTPKLASYFEQTVPIVMNKSATLTTVATDVDFIAEGAVEGRCAGGFIEADLSNILHMFLLIIGRVVNTFAGQNNLDCTVAADNQWRAVAGTGTYWDLHNPGCVDGQMLDADWNCVVQGAIHPFVLMFDITGRFTALGNSLGIRLQNARSRQNNLVVTIDAFMKVVWKL